MKNHLNFYPHDKGLLVYNFSIIKNYECRTLQASANKIPEGGAK